MDLKLYAKRYTLNAQKGFTLLEALLAISIFSIMTIVILDVFTRTQSIQARASSMQKLQDDGRFIMNKIASDIRNGSLLYECYESHVPGVCDAPIDSLNGNAVLALKDREGTTVVMKQGITVAECGLAKNTPCLLISKSSDLESVNFSRISEGNSKISDFRVFLFPDKNPFALTPDGVAYQSNDQPRVRVAFTETSTVTRKKEEATLTLQTLVSTREYRR